ncbi:MAG: MerR family transcriptional regulator [Nocardioides sp.]|uniref:MerR family transcriptional regulator n=1 Tax=Nocardioides sp. TaxID=35761 RepID=UPI0039E6B282
MLIGELAERTGASTRSLRHYERAGLIRSVRLANGYRDFDADQIAAVATIRDLLAAGLTLDAVAAIGPCYEESTVPTRCERATARLRSELDRLDDRAAEIDRARTRITALLGAE